MAKDANYKSLLPQVDRNRQFVETQFRYSLAMAAYGLVTAQQVLIREDIVRLPKAIEVVPRARELAMAAMRARISQP